MSPHSQTESNPVQRPQPRPAFKGGTLFLIVLLLGGLLFYGAYHYIGTQFTLLQRTVENRMTAAVAAIQADNNTRIDLLAEALAGVTTEMETVKQALKEADLTISASASTESNLQVQLEELEEQLAKLQRTIVLLQENH